MKKNLILVTLGVLALTACNQNAQKETVDASVVEEMNVKYQEANDYKDSLLLLMTDIYAGLDSINMQEGLLINPGVGDNADRRAEVKENLYLIRQRLEANKNLLAELEKKAKDANANSAVLQRTITQMKDRIEQQDAKIAELNELLANANEQISNLTGEVAQTRQDLEDQTKLTEDTQAQLTATENEVNTVYYVIGTNKQLKDYKVLEKRFLGPTRVMQGDEINYSCFTKADKRTLLSIPTGAKKVEIKSYNDPDSYKIVGGKDEPKTIDIINPETFWQKTPYLIIEVK